MEKKAHLKRGDLEGFECLSREIPPLDGLRQPQSDLAGAVAGLGDLQPCWIAVLRRQYVADHADRAALTGA